METTLPPATVTTQRVTAPFGRSPQLQPSLTRQNRTLRERLSRQAAELKQKARQLRDLAIELTRVEERERQRMARILHDDLQQTLSAAYLSISIHKTKTTDPQVLAVFAGLAELIAEAIATSRTLTSDLCPGVGKQESFAAALAWLAREAREKHDLEVEVNADPLVNPCNQEIHTILIRCVRELLFNAAKHAQVKTASVGAFRDASWIRIVVEDRGVGFDPVLAGGTTRGGYGLFSLRDRIACLGGSLELISAPGNGTRALLAVPR